MSRPRARFLTPTRENRADAQSPERALDPFADVVREAGAGQGLVGFEAGREPPQGAPQERDLSQVTAAGRAVEQVRPQGDPFQPAEVAVERLRREAGHLPAGEVEQAPDGAAGDS